ncbi:hypothetical protein [Candidatus Tisiphia endosymbiont of Dioctria rufipes]|uniref:hypothetical protein n=1 Tax=Candidatus Tisiphia endosymbiont of Dioctria rufipes TaxID=3066255 RepID=UPI00312CBA50
MISSNNDIGNTVNNVINREPLPHINNINPKLLKAAAVLLSQAHNAKMLVIHLLRLEHHHRRTTM